MRRLANHHHASIADSMKKWIEVGVLKIMEWLTGPGDHFAQAVACWSFDP